MIIGHNGASDEQANGEEQHHPEKESSRRGPLALLGGGPLASDGDPASSQEEVGHAHCCHIGKTAGKKARDEGGRRETRGRRRCYLRKARPAWWELDRSLSPAVLE